MKHFTKYRWISGSTKVEKGLLLILDRKEMIKKFKDIETKGNHGHPCKLQQSKDKGQICKNTREYL